MVQILLIASFLYVYSSAQAQQQAPPIQWARSFGGSDIDVPISMQHTTDNGFIIAGFSYSNDFDVAGHHGTADAADFWIVKLDSIGTLEWQRSLGGDGDDIARSIKQTQDGGYIVVGESTSSNWDVSGNHGLEDYWVVKLDRNGSITWKRSLGGTGSDKARDVDVTADGGYILCGSSNSINGDVSGHHGDTSMADCWIVKLDHDGNISWQKTFGGSAMDEAFVIRQTSDVGYIFAGYSNSKDGDVTVNQGGRDFWIVKLDSAGKLLWQRSLGGSGDDIPYSIDLTTDAGVVAAGYSNSTDGNVSHGRSNADFWIVKLNSLGALKWDKSYGGSDQDAAYSIRNTFDHGFIVGGTSASTDGDVTVNQGGNDYWLLKLDPSGNLQWQKTFGGPGEEFLSVALQTSDSEFVLAGSSDFEGGDVTGNHGHEDYWILKLSNKQENSVADGSTSANLTIFPNPFSSRTTINIGAVAAESSEIKVYNILGEAVREIRISSGTSSLTLDRKGLPVGVYIVEISTEGHLVQRGRVVIE